MTTHQSKSHHVSISDPDERGWARLAIDSGRPMNAMTLGLVEDLLDTVRNLRNREGLRVLEIRGTATAFSGGADLRTVSEMDDDTYRTYIEAEFALFEAVETLDAITVAVIGGPCLGNAAELALACDFRLASTRAVFGLAETRVGFQGPTQRITKYVGIGVAKDLLYRGRILGAEEAHAMGLISACFDDDRFDDDVAAFIAELTALPPVAVSHTKRNLASAYQTVASPLEAEIGASLSCRDTEDFREGVEAFFAKRPPRFAGR